MRVIARMARAGDEAGGIDAGFHSQRSPTRAGFASTRFFRDHELRERQWELEDQVEMLQSELRKERARLELERKRGETERLHHQKLQDQIKQLHFEEHKWRLRNENTAFFTPSCSPDIVPDGSRWNSAPAPMTTTTSPEDVVYAVASLLPSCHAPKLLSKRCLQFFTHPTLVCLSVCFICAPQVANLRARLTCFYLSHAPQKIARVDAIVSAFISRGSSQQALQDLNEELLETYGFDLDSTQSFVSHGTHPKVTKPPTAPSNQATHLEATNRRLLSPQLDIYVPGPDRQQPSSSAQQFPFDITSGFKLSAIFNPLEAAPPQPSYSSHPLPSLVHRMAPTSTESATQQSLNGSLPPSTPTTPDFTRPTAGQAGLLRYFPLQNREQMVFSRTHDPVPVSRVL